FRSLGESVMFEAARSSTLAFGKLIGPLSVIAPAKPLTAGEPRLPSQPAYIFSAPVPLFVMLPVELMLMNPCERSRSVFEDARLPDGPMMSIPQPPQGLMLASDVVILTFVLPRAVAIVPQVTSEAATVLVQLLSGFPPSKLPFASGPISEIVTSAGSRSSTPVVPLIALVLTVALKSSQFLPDTSTNPPLPPCAPPFALIDP